MALKSNKNVKEVSPSQIPHETLKCMNDDISYILLDSFNEAYKTGHGYSPLFAFFQKPQTWKTSVDSKQYFYCFEVKWYTQGIVEINTWTHQ